MKDLANTLLTTAEVADRWRLKAATVRKKAAAGILPAIPTGGGYRVRVEDMWACEDGPTPRAEFQQRHLEPLLTTQDLMRRTRLCEKTIGRYVKEGLPTRNVGGNVRFDYETARTWFTGKYGKDLLGDRA